MNLETFHYKSQLTIFSHVHFCCLLCPLWCSLFLLGNVIHSTRTANTDLTLTQEINAVSGLVRIKKFSVPSAQTVIFNSNFNTRTRSKQKSLIHKVSVNVFCAPKLIWQRFFYHHLVCWRLVYKPY